MSLIGTIKRTGRYSTESAAECIALLVGPFAVFLENGAWNLTHTGTGLAIRYRFCCVFHAIATAEAIMPLIDWYQPKEAVESAGKAAGVGPIVNATQCPVGHES